MNIAIFDTEHFETTYTLIRLFEQPGSTIFLFTNNHCKQRLTESLAQGTPINWIVQEPDESHRHFARRMYRLLEEFRIHMLFYNTISHNHLLHAFLITKHPNLRSLLTVHDINDLTYYPATLSLRQLVRNTGKRLLLKRIKELNVISETMIPGLRKKIGRHQIIHNIPGSIFEKIPAPSVIPGAINLVVPGTIDKKRRDYNQVIALAKHCDELALPVNITLLGQPYGTYGREMINRVNSLKLEKVTLATYNSEVPQPEFDNIVRQAHFVFVPAVEKSLEAPGAVEIYGETKSSGSIFDAVRHAKPLIIPEFLKVPSAIENRCFRYVNVNQLPLFLKEMLAQPETYQHWQHEALKSSQEFTIEKIRNANSSLFL